jgi:hypothetical protein
MFSDVTSDIVDAFAVPVVYVRADGRRRTVPAVFENAFRHFDLGGTPVESNTPEAHLKTADMPSGAARGDLVIVAGATYAVRDIKPDGAGLTVLVLTETL